MTKRKILFLSATPDHWARLHVTREYQAIEDTLSKNSNHQFELKHRGAIEADSLRNILRDEAMHIVHFSGHGEGEEGLVLENSTGQAYLLENERLARIFELTQEQHERSIQCVLFNCCHSVEQAKSILNHVECVIGMSRDITDRAAQKLSTVFYESLCSGSDYALAYEYACEALAQDFEKEQDMPQLFLRGQSFQAYKKTFMSKARDLERNKSYKQAGKYYLKILKVNELDTEAQQRLERIQRIIKYLSHINKIRSIVVNRHKNIKDSAILLNQLNRLATNDDPKITSVFRHLQSFLKKDISAEGFHEKWTAIINESTSKPPTQTIQLDYENIAQKIKEGDFMLFLGAEFTCQCDIHYPNLSHIIKKLAENINYPHCEQWPAASNISELPPLSQIAEYYRMAGSDRQLRRDLFKLLDHSIQIPFYTLLAQQDEHLILISACYDRLLENTFLSADKPFVEIYTLLNEAQHPEKMGGFLLKYSDKKEAEEKTLDELSTLELLKNYSIIYKIRGQLHAPSQPEQHQNTIIISEEQYFSFAAYAHTLIPDYLVSQFNERNFLFLGSTPHHWDDRLLMRTLFHKRARNAGKSFVVQKKSDAFTDAYWQEKNVERYPIDLAEFIYGMEEFLCV